MSPAAIPRQACLGLIEATRGLIDSSWRRRRFRGKLASASLKPGDRRGWRVVDDRDSEASLPRPH